MKNLELKNLEVMELTSETMIETNGGMGYDAGGRGLVSDRAKGDGIFYVGFIKGLYKTFFN